MPVAQPSAPERVATHALTGYSMPDGDEVLTFVAARPHLRLTLEEAPRRVERAFGRNLPLRLKVFHDCEEPASAELVVEIVTGNAGAEGWMEGERNLRRLHEQWLAAVPREITRDILFVTEPE